MNATSLLQEIVAVAREDFGSPRHVWQLAIVVLALVAGGLFSRAVQRRVAARVQAQSSRPAERLDLLQFSIDGFRRLAFPISSIAVLVIGGLAMRVAGLVRSTADVQFLRLAFTLLVALAGIRLLVYVLHRSFPRSNLIGTFERAIGIVIWVLAALHVTGVLGDVVAALEGIHVPIGTASQVTLWDLIVGAISVVLTLLISMWIGSVVEARLMGAKSLAPNSRVVLSRLVRALLVLVAVLIALSLVGIDLTVLSVFGGALGVGLGLGLQRIASNYVSGFIILFDRSLSIGDMITVDKFYGAVTQINTRYTVIKALDGTETIVPNEMLVSAPVVNHSYTDRKVRLAVKVSVSYASDLDLALGVLTEAARAHPRVLADPEPGAFVTGFGADGIDLEVGFWIRDPEEGTLGVRSEISRSLLRRFREEQIEIPFPQRDVRISGFPAQPDRGGQGPERYAA